MRRFDSLRRQGDFARVRARGSRTATANLTIFRSLPSGSDACTLVGISISKAVGGAVVRNRVRRRLQSCVDRSLPAQARMRLVISARPSAATASYEALCAQVRQVLET